MESKLYKSDYVDWKNPVKFDPFIHEPKERKFSVRFIIVKILRSMPNQLFAVIDDLCALIVEDLSQLNYANTSLMTILLQRSQYVMDTWKQSDGDLPTIHKAVVEIAFKNPQFNRKFLMPETWWLQASRMLDIEFLMTQESFWKHDFRRWPEAQFQIIELMEDLGHHPFDFKQPNGYMDNEQGMDIPPK